MNQQETEQFAALRMHVAHLHNALDSLIVEVASAEVAAGRDLVPDAVRAATHQALAQSEPELRAMVLAIGQDGDVLAKLRSQAMQAAISGVRAHHEDVRKARAEGDAALAHANTQLQSQGQALVACRSELQSKSDALAHVAARLGKIEGKARVALKEFGSRGDDIDATKVSDAMDELAEALK